MVQNLKLSNDGQTMAVLIVCCLIILAAVMIPQAIRYRKQMKRNGSGRPVLEKEQEIEPKEKQDIQVPVTQPRENAQEKRGQANYRETFVRRNEFKTRECVYVSRETHSKIVKLVRALEDTGITIGGYIDLVLSEHLEQNREDINEIFRQSRRDLL